jgi:hypothetical protein
MQACVHALVPPSGGGPGSRREALERVVIVRAMALRLGLGMRERCVDVRWRWSTWRSGTWTSLFDEGVVTSVGSTSTGVFFSLELKQL